MLSDNIILSALIIMLSDNSMIKADNMLADNMLSGNMLCYLTTGYLITCYHIFSLLWFCYEYVVPVFNSMPIQPSTILHTVIQRYDYSTIVPWSMFVVIRPGKCVHRTLSCGGERRKCIGLIKYENLILEIA
jgi:hypothetical protein